MTDRMYRRTPEMERARTLTVAQREGFAIGYVRGRFDKAHAATGVDLETARAEAKARFPIWALQRRHVTDGEYRFQLAEDGKTVLVQRQNQFPSAVTESPEVTTCVWWEQTMLPATELTPVRVRLMMDVVEKPDEPFITEE